MHTPAQIVTDFIAAWNELDYPRIESFMSPAIVYHNIPMEPIIGIGAFRAFVAAFPAHAARWTVHMIAAQGNAVLTERTDEFWFAGGKHLSLPVMGVFEIEDGLIAKWRDYFDLAQMQKQLA